MYRLVYTLLLATCFLPAAPAPAGEPQPLQIGSRRELFLDTLLIQSTDGVQLHLHEPRDAGAVLNFDAPWEGRFCGYATVIHDGDVYRLYYRGLPEAAGDGSRSETTCYAESTDGISWTKPNLGLFEVHGTRENNVVLADAAPVTHNFCPFLDTNPEAQPAERFKAVGGTSKSGLIGYVSADGVRWTRWRDEPVFKDEGWVFDSQNVPFWSDAEGCYVLYYRRAADRIRAIARATSPDFVRWSAPVQMTYSDTDSTVPSQHLYTNQTHPYFRATHIYLATAARFMPGRQVITDAQAEAINVHPSYFKDTSDAVLMTSRGGDRYDRTFLSSLIRPGIGVQNWVSRTNYPALNIVQTGPTEMSLYVNQNYGQPTAHLRRYTLRLDGLSSLRAPYEGGEMVTRPLVFAGARLVLNFSTSAAGGIRVEIQETDGTPIPGYSLGDATELIGNEIEREASWTSGSDVSSLAGRPVRLRFVMKDADLFSLQFQLPVAVSAAEPSSAEIVDVRKIWDAAPHNAFTDLIRHRDRWYCVFREGQGHVSPDGALRVLTSDDGETWRSASLVTSDTADLRDAKITTTPDGRLMLSGAGALHPPAAAKHQSYVWFSDDGTEWSDAVAIGDPDFWIWRVVWHKETAYGIGYATTDPKRIRLYHSRDGRTFDVLVPELLTEGYPNETSLIFQEDDTCLCLLRRDGTPNSALLGRAEPPYTDWTWDDLELRIGGPHFVTLSDGRIVVAGRHYPGGATTRLWWLETGKPALHEIAKFPSGGDTSYPGLVYHDGLLWVSYYSSHEGKTSIYLARVKLPPRGSGS